MVIIGLSCTPSTITSVDECTGVEVKVSHGGGLGGTSYHIHVTEIVDKPEDEMLSKMLGSDELIVRTIKGEEVVLNQKYVVSKRPVKYVTVESDVTAHHNYRKHTCRSAIQKRVYRMTNDTDYNIVHEYIGLDKYDSCVLNDTIKE